MVIAMCFLGQLDCTLSVNSQKKIHCITMTTVSFPNDLSLGAQALGSHFPDKSLVFKPGLQRAIDPVT